MTWALNTSNIPSFQYRTRHTNNTLTACSSPMSVWLNNSTSRFFHNPEAISCCVSRMNTAMVNQGNWGAEGRTNREFGAVVPAVNQDSKANTPPPPVCWYSGLWQPIRNKVDEGGCLVLKQQSSTYIIISAGKKQDNVSDCIVLHAQEH